MNYDWDPVKTANDARKPGVAFEQAATIFGDPLVYTISDPDHSAGHERLLTFGLSIKQRVLVVSHIENEQGIRIISAREATPHERKTCQEG